MITHKTFKDEKGNWVMPKDVGIKGDSYINTQNGLSITEGPTEKMSKSKKNVIEPNEILENYGINATRIFMISDSPPDRELEWTDEGIQSSKNLIHRIERYFEKEKSSNENLDKKIEKYVHDIENNILNFSLNKCVANIYTLFNYLEKSKIYLGDSNYSKKILICLFPIVPDLSSKLFKKLFAENVNQNNWPDINYKLLEEEAIELPIQIKGKLTSTIKTKKGYQENDIMKLIYQIDKIKAKIDGKEVIKIINVQDKIINIITN
jgi:leucyl-tRNA synthetase